MLSQAIALHQDGLLAEAQALYERILETQPNHCDALHLLGVLATQAGDPRLAAERIGKAITTSPDSAPFYSNRGIALRQLGQLDAAVASYDRALGIQPDYPEAHYNRGAALKERLELDAAVASFDRAIAIAPDYAAAYSNRGIALTELGRPGAAVPSYERAIAIKADYAVAYSNHGVALQGLKQPGAAIVSFECAIALEADYVEAYSNRGAALQELKQFDAAVTSHDRAIAIRSDYAEAHYNRGIALQQLGQMEAAVASYNRAIGSKPDYTDAYSNRGMALQELKRLEAAVASFDQAIATQPESAEAHFNKSLALLLAGDFANGWQLYEWRWDGSGLGKEKRQFSQPLWLGSDPIAGKTILLHAEQGLGDAIQFCRYAKLVAARGARVILEVPGPLVGLLDGLEGVSELVTTGAALPPFDCHCPLLTLPFAFKTNLANIPGHSAYLTADNTKLAAWFDRLGRKTRPRVGIVWSGSVVHKNDRNRSIPLSSVLPYLPDTLEYVSLQREVRDVDQEILATHHSIRHFGDELVDFTDTAALCGLMDLVISVDTSVAHLSGALGRRTWVLLPYVPDWRWLLDRDDSPWYASLRLYRQDADRDWTRVFERVEADLAALFPQFISGTGNVLNTSSNASPRAGHAPPAPKPPAPARTGRH